MRPIALALLISLIGITPALAQQQTPPPPPPPPTAPTRPATTVPVTGARGARVSGPVVVGAQQVTPVLRADTQRPGAVSLAATNAPSSWQNVKLDVVIADSLIPDLQSKKTINMLILDGRAGQIRSSAGEGLINIDARPTIRPDGRIYVQLTIEYRPELTQPQLEKAGGRTALYSESLSLLVADGKPVLASQSADPRSDRKVSIEITATIIK